MDGLTVDGGTNSIINGSSGEGLQFQRGGAAQVRIDSVNNDGGVYHAPTGKNHTFKTDGVNRVKFATGGDISFYEDTGSTAKFFWDASAESLGIGTDSPSGLISISSGSGTKATIETTRNFTVNRNFQIAVDEYAEGTFTITPSTTLGGSSYTTPIITATAAGNVGIGTNSPESLLHVKAADTVTGVIKIEGGKNTVTSNGEINSQLDFGSNDISVNNTGNIGGRIASVTETENGAYTGMAFYTFTQDASPDLSEKVRITHNGKVGIGETSPDKLLH